MKAETEQTAKKDTKTADRKRLLYTIMSVVLLAALIAGLTYAWFFQESDMATLMKIKEPSDIAILGPDGAEMDSIDLDDAAAVKDGEKVTIRKVFCVQNAEDAHRLEIVHTTNMKGLNFKLYKVSADGKNTITENGTAYKYSTTPLDGSYINKSASTEAYTYADNSFHSKNYDAYDSSYVQNHAEPVYWLTDGSLTTDKSTENSVTINRKTFYRTYYVCEVSWTETTKETDIFYILAENASTQENN